MGAFAPSRTRRPRVKVNPPAEESEDFPLDLARLLASPAFNPVALFDRYEIKKRIAHSSRPNPRR